ncbi:MAG: FMN-binding negative transcriptional regulator [Flavobacterium sp.]|nr:MAG: FMN-binding negative transcriptional regulator [Flavobacterium sp.]
MHIPEYYKNENSEEIQAFLKANSFGILVSKGGGKLLATHIPLELETNPDGKLILEGHVSKENPQWNHFETGDEVLAIFSGPHAYVSSSWYDFEGVPTWNYIAVHVYGKIRIVSEEELIASLTKLVDKYESGRDNPTKVENLSRKTMMMSRAIVGFEIEITDIQAKKKLSQNRDDKNYESVVSHLEQSGEAAGKAIASEMKKIRK